MVEILSLFDYMRPGTRTEESKRATQSGLRILNGHLVGSIETEEGVDGGKLRGHLH